MKRATHLSLLTLVLACFAADGLAQERIVRLTTNYPQAMVFADSVWLGPASRGVFAVPPAARQLRLVAPAADAWSLPTRTAPLGDAGMDTLALTLNFPYAYRVETIPFDVPVFLETAEGRFELGRTPFTHLAEAPLQGTLLIDHPGYTIVRMEPGLELWNRHALALQPVTAQEEVRTVEVAWRPPPKRRRWIDYAAAATAITGGVLAVHFKIKADNRYDAYQLDGNPALRARITQFDRYSGVALGAMQVGVGVFAIRLVLR